MHNLFNILIALILTLNVSAQSCPVNDWIEENYLFDARILTLREILADEMHPWNDSVNLPDSMVNGYLGLISTVFEQNTGTTDSLFDAYKIHIFPEMSYNMLRMDIDTNYSWIREYLKDSLISGNPVFDSLTALYDFSLVNYGYYSVTASAMTLETDKVLNITALTDAFEQLEGISDVVPEQWAGDGADIRINFSGDTAYLDFSYGWMDCPAGCVFRYHWYFSVHQCDVAFLGTDGDPYSNVETRKVEEHIIFPNPARDRLFIANPNEELLKIRIYSLDGKLSFEAVTFSGELNISSVHPGMYILCMESKSESLNVLLIKR